MPGTTGLDVLRAAAGADDRLARTPFLVVSAMYMTRTERDVLGPRVAAVVRKGDTMMEELRSNLRRVLGDRTTTAEGDHPEPASAPPHRKARVLIVDDNADNLFSLREVLAPLPITIETASTGAEAIAACRQHPPDLIVMDVELPGPSGLETARAIRSLPDCANIPVIALTADAMPTDRERALADCNSYLAKPVQPKQVVSAVTRALHIQLH
jgi:CheY-like chemotaxis protein